MKNRLFLFLLLPIFFLSFLPLKAAPALPIDIYMFSADGCPHCAKMKAEIENMKEAQYPQINFQDFEINHNADNQKIFIEYSKIYNFDIEAVPVILIGKNYLIGENINGLHQTVANCLIEACPSPQTIYDEYFKTNPPIYDNSVTTNPNYPYVGWAVLIIAAVGGIALLIKKLKN
jgi:glutaredoxin